MPEMFDNNSIEQWQAEGSSRSTNGPSTRARDLLNEYEEPKLDAGVNEALLDYIARREREIPAADALNQDLWNAGDPVCPSIRGQRPGTGCCLTQHLRNRLRAKITADWLVIGAGFAGLAAARRLSQHCRTDRLCSRPCAWQMVLRGAIQGS